MWGSSKYDRELNVVTRIFQTALTQHGGHDKRGSEKNEFSSCDVDITKMTADHVTNYVKGNEINVQMSRFNYFTRTKARSACMAFRLLECADPSAAFSLYLYQLNSPLCTP